MSISRFNAVEKASNRKAVEAVTPEHKVSEYYGENVFNRKAMQKYLSKETYKALTMAHLSTGKSPIMWQPACVCGHWKKESLITPTGFNRLPMAPPRSTTLSWNTMVTVA